MTSLTIAELEKAVQKLGTPPLILQYLELEGPEGAVQVKMTNNPYMPEGYIAVQEIGGERRFGWFGKDEVHGGYAVWLLNSRGSQK